MSVGEDEAVQAPVDEAGPRAPAGGAPGTDMPDLATLLSPISAEQPTGDSLRYSEVYDQIKEARREDDPTLPQGVWQTKLKQADWATVEAASIEALTTRSKDLQIGAWLLEAWFHLHGMVGVRDGLVLLRELCERYWDDLYPELGQGLEARTAPIRWLNEKFPTELWLVNVTQPEHDPSAVTTFSDWENARGAAEPATRTRLRESAVLTPRRFYIQELTALDEASEAAAQLETGLRERCGDEAPTLHQLKSQLDALRQLLAALVAEHHGNGDESPFATQSEAGSAAEAGEGSTVSANPIRSRAEAYQRLAEVADYLSRAEPHSPTPYLIRRAVAWGRMPLSDLLQELVRDPSDLRAAYSLLGIAPDSAP